MRVADFKKEIREHPARSAWDKGRRQYALEIFCDVVENRNLTDADELGADITEAEQLCGARDWREYSYGGCSLIYDSDICDRLCTEKGAERLKHGERKPVTYDNWLDAQASALKQAARLVRWITNRRVAR